MKIKLFSLILISMFAFSANAQTMGKIADDTFGYIKAGTFGKPKVAKNTSKLSLGQVRVHYKLITSRDSVQKGNAADVTVYLDTDLTNGDLQNLTNEFYSILQQKLTAIGIEFADWKSIESTEYFAERQKSNEDKKQKDYDGKAGQAWVTFNAFDGPVLVRWKPYGTTEILGFGQMKKMAKASETTGGDLMTLDVVLDFASIMLNTEIKQDKGFIFYGDPYFHADYSIGGMISVPQSYIFMLDKKNGFDQYKNELPIAERFAFADKPYKDESKAALKTQNFFGTERHTFTPLVIPAKRDLYLTAARRTLTLYAELLVEKMKVLRSGEKPSDKDTAQKPVDNTNLQQVNSEAKKNNETTAVTTGELTAAAKQAEKEGKFKLAVDYYTELIKKDPNEMQYFLSRGALYLNELKDYKAAIKDFEQGIKLNPNEPIFYYNRGTAYTKLEDWKKAKKDFDSHISMNPNFAEAYLNRGIANIYLKDLDAALADFNKGIQVNPRYPNLYRARALVYKAKGNAAAAQADEITAARLGN
ncbi:MAG TPA: tetratricopeptide repeat protein [Pyrinomonadaceae bacterium]|nr:tetratricopeptide repeat protein [Pyrinomonadaceae bacterium]